MSYPNYLATIIKNSKLSLRAIARLCENNYNVKITASYLSKLKKEGNQNPASERVNIAIAKVCKTNPEDLIFEAELERAPQIVKEIINELVEFIKKFFAQTNKSLSVSNKELELQIQGEINQQLNMSTREFLKSLMQYSALEENENPFEIGLDLDEDNMKDILMKFSLNVLMEDNSMFPIIKQGAKMELVKLDEYSNGDIISVTLNNDKKLIRTYAESGNNIILIPANQDFETLNIPKKDVIINGKVKSYTIDL